MFIPWPKIPRLLNEKFHFTEKIDGTNACVIIKPYEKVIESNQYCYRTITIDEYTIFTQSRNRLITIENDNFQFAKWVYDNAKEILKLGIGYHYGEWWGNGINKRYSIKEKKFSLFNTIKWSKTNKPECCEVVPYFGSCNLENLEKIVQQTQELLQNVGSCADPFCKNPEGFMIYCELQNQYYKIILDKNE